MILHKLKLTGIILILLIAGCTKEDPHLNDPVKMPLAVFLTDTEISNTIWDYDNGDEEYSNITFTEGWIAAEKVEFEGMREAGGMYYFENYPGLDCYTFQLQSNPTVAIGNFDIPQGVYDYFRWDLYLKEIEYRGRIHDEDIESLRAGLVIKGNYKHGFFSWVDENNKVFFSIPFVLAIDFTEKFCFRSVKEILIDPSKSDWAVIALTFNMHYVFNMISCEAFENADISGDSLDQRIIISSTKNTDLYEFLLYRLGMSTKVGLLTVF